MMDTTLVSGKRKAPEYTLAPGEVWFHFLYGNVPGHEIDFIYLPEVPQPPLTRLHVNHLKQSVKFIEPRAAMPYAFSIANLSRGDSQYEPGHGGIAFVFGLRIHGALDHAGRQDPPFCHAAALIDRHLDIDAIYSISVQFHQKLLAGGESRAEGSGWYHTYVSHAQNPDAVLPLLRGYVQDFSGILYTPPPSRLSLRWTVGDKPKALRRVSVVYKDNTDFPTLAFHMARIAAVLIESDLKWTAISNGREQDLNGGMAVRFIPRRDAENEAADDVLVMYLEQIPEEPAEIAKLFGLFPARVSQLPELRINVPLPTPAPMEEKSNGVAHVRENAVQLPESARVAEKFDSIEPMPPRRDLVKELKKKERKQSTALVAGGGLFALVLIGAWVVWTQLKPRDIKDMMADAGAPEPPATISAKPAVTAKPEQTATAMPAPAPMPSATMAPIEANTTASPKPTTPPKPRPTTTGPIKTKPIDPFSNL